MKRVACLVFLTLLLSLTGVTSVRAVEEFVGDAEPSDDLTKMCIKMR